MLAARPPKSVPLTKPGLITSNLSSKAMMHCPSIPSMPNRTCSPSSMLSSRSHLTLLSYSHGPCVPAFCCVTWAPLPPAAYAPESMVLPQAPYYLSARHQNATDRHLLLLFGVKKETQGHS